MFTNTRHDVIIRLAQCHSDSGSLFLSLDVRSREKLTVRVLNPIFCINNYIRRLLTLLLNCSLLFLFCLLEQIEVLCSRYEQYLLLLSTMYMYIDSLERRVAEF